MNANASCPRCGSAFHCGANDALPCACGQFTLSPASTQMLRAQYERCVCMACLAQLQEPDPQDAKKPAQS